MTSAINVRADKDIKQQAEQICSDLGISMSTAVNMFLRAIVRNRGIPFELQLKKPNKTTIKALEEAGKIANDNKVKGYNNIEDLKKALEV